MLLPFTGAFLVGLAVGSFLPYLPLTVLVLLIIVALALTLVEHSGNLSPREGLIIYAALLAGLTYWTLNGPVPITSSSRSAETAVELTGTVVQPVRHGPDRTVFILETDATTLADRPIRTVRVTWRFPDQDLIRGDRVALSARLREPSSTRNPGGFDYAAHLRRAGIEAVASVTGPRAVTKVLSDSIRWRSWQVIDRWRNRIRNAAVATLADPALGVYLGIIAGESGYLIQSVRDDFMATGTVHILSISGSHLGLIAVLSFWVVKGICRVLPNTVLLSMSRHITPTRLAALLTFIPVAFYTVLAGAEVATVRAFIMILLFLLTVWMGHEQQLLLALALAALVLLLHDPGALFEISFQLSFLSVLAIALVLPWRMQTRGLRDPTLSGRLMRWASDYFWITGSITLITFPLVAYYFNQIAWLGMAANAIVVPFAGFVLIPLGLLAAIGTLLTGSDVLIGGHLNQWLLDLFCGTMAQLARLPGVEWHVSSPALLAIGLYYVLMLVAWRTVQARVAWGSVVIGVLVLCWWVWSPRLWQSDELRVTFLDVGQGDAALLELPDGQTVLIDAGTAQDSIDMGRSVVAPYLWDRGIRRVDHVIATHPQLDHVGGLASIVEKFEVGQYWDNGVRRAEPFYQRLDDVLYSRMVAQHSVTAGQTLAAGNGCRLVALNPPGTSDGISQIVPVPNGTVLNNLSVVTHLDCGRLSFLFTADIEHGAIQRLRQRGLSLRVSVLKVPHHGARSSLDGDWLRTIHPDVAVISVGRHNPYGHPAAVVLQAYAQVPQLLRTDRHGAIWFTGNPGSGALQTYRTQDFSPVPIRFQPEWWSSEYRNLTKLFGQILRAP